MITKVMKSEHEHGTPHQGPLLRGVTCKQQCPLLKDTQQPEILEAQCLKRH